MASNATIATGSVQSGAPDKALPVARTRLENIDALRGFVMVLMLLLMPLSLALGTHLDYGKIGACVLGMLLLVGAFAAAGLFMSTLTRQPAVAAVSTFGLLLFLWIINWLGQGDSRYQGVLHYLSFTDHYTTLLRGSFDSVDVAFYVLFIATFLGLSIRRLDSARLQA